MNKYDDIIHLKHHLINRNPMPIYKRAAIFSPFSALIGYEESLEEVRKVTVSKKELNDEQKNEINNKIILLQKNIKSLPLVEIEFFKKDIKKNSGNYYKVIDQVKKIDISNQKIILLNQSIPFNDIVNIIIKN